MQGTTKLVAIRDIPVSTGHIKTGTVFLASGYLTTVYITAGLAVLEAEYIKQGWGGLAWKGTAVAVLASGDSFSEEQAAAVLQWRNQDRNGRKVMAINTTYQRAPWADVIYACDRPWWTEYHKRVVAACPDAQLWTQDAKAAELYELNHIPSLRKEGLSLEPGVINQGENGGYQAIGLAHQAGAKTVYLLGFDMQGGHWHGPHPGNLNKVNTYDRWLKNFVKFAVDCKAVNLEVINCTSTTALRSFPQKHWTEVFHDRDVPDSGRASVPPGCISDRTEENRV